MTTIPGFLTKTYEIFNTPEYTDCCGWGNNGSTIVIKKIEQFSKSVLPKYFKHSNFQSFVRQLNMYDFRKTVQDPNHGEFQHPNFRQDRPELLPHIKRKAHHKSSESNKKSLSGLQPEGSEFPSLDSSLTAASLSAAASLNSMGCSTSHTHNYLENNLNLNNSNSSASKTMYENFKDEVINSNNDHNNKNNNNESESLMNEITRQQNIRDEFEIRLQNMEEESVRVSTENIVLKQLILDSRQKQAIMQDRMEKVLKTLFNIFMGGVNNNNNNNNHLAILDANDINLKNVDTNNNINTKNILLDSDSVSTDDKSMNSLAVSSNSTDMISISSVPKPSLAPQMLESLIFRLDSLQSHGLRMNGNSDNNPGIVGLELGLDNSIIDSMFCDEDILPLSDIAADITRLVTSCRNGNRNNDGDINTNININENENLLNEIINHNDESRKNISDRLNSSINNQTHNINNNSNSNSNIDSNNYNKLNKNNYLSSSQTHSNTNINTNMNINMNTNTNKQSQSLSLAQSQNLNGQQISQMPSFDTMASRVSAPNLLRLQEMSVHKSEESNRDRSISPTSINLNHSKNNHSNNSSSSSSSSSSNNNNNNSNSNQDMGYRGNDKNSDVIYGGGELIRQRSIYPGRGNSDYETQQSTTALLSSNTSLNILNGIPVDRQDSDNFSWSGLFSINSIDGYGMISSSSDNNFSLSSPGGSINLTNTINSINENNNIKIKEEIIREEKNIKRGIAELGSNDEIQYNDKNNDNRDNNFRRQKLSTSFPLVNSQVVGASSNNSLNTIINSGTNNNSNINQMQNLGSGSMDPPSGYYSQSGNESTQFGKQETSEPFYGNFQRNNPSETSLSRIDSLELTIATLLKSMDSFDANNNNNNNSNNNNNNNSHDNNNHMNHNNNNHNHAPG